MSVARRNPVAAGEADGARGDLMKAIVQDRFGPPGTLQLADIVRPEIRSGEILLKVHAAAVNPYDWPMVRGDPRIARLMGGVGLTKPKTPNRRSRRNRPGPGRRRRCARLAAR